MKILMLNNEFPPLGGGTGTVNEQLLKQFNQHENLEIDFITSALGKKYEFEQYSDTIRIYKVPVNNKILHNSSHRELITYAILSFALALKLFITRRYRFCFAWSAVPAGFVALLLKKIFGLKYIVRVCGVDIPGFEERYKSTYRVLTPIIKKIWSNSERIIAKCQEEVDMINAVSTGLNPLIIPNGVDGRRFNGVNKEKSNGVLKLICVGRLIERKGQIYLIRAARQLLDEGHEVQVDIVGTGHLEQYYTKQARDLELDGTVRFRGYVPREQIPACYNQADVFVLASFNEGMSVSTLEAMASSLPVVVTRTGGIHDLVKERENGFIFDYGDQGALVEHLRYFVQNPERIRLMGRKSRTVAEKFTWKEISQKYIKLFSMFDHP